MEFRQSTSPHLSVNTQVQDVMLKVLYALVPGTLVAIWFFGWGVLINLCIAAIVCLGSEALILKLRKRPVQATLLDGSALITAVLLALALPPLAPWWLTTIAALFAIVIAKQLYGGLGFNMFNPAMVGYIVVMISFPREMTFWTPPLGVTAGDVNGYPGLLDTLRIIFSGTSATEIDAVTMATPIDTIKAQLGLEQDIETTRQSVMYGPLFSTFTGKGWEWINLAFLAGGIWLVKSKAADWRLPTAFLLSLGLIANLFSVIDYATYTSTLFHLLSGGTMLAAFFIVTDPVSASTTPRGRWIYGAGIGVLTYVIRTWGGYPDGIAFAVVLMNMAVPIIDYTTRPKIFGRKTS
jgi:electron transport complex protein RnfD